jgi:ElaB/YqjD/DUF883 family membrane-anchored ribosome-binding protein
MSDLSRSANDAAKNAKARAEAVKDDVSEAVDRGASNIADKADAARDALAQDLRKLREDMASIQQTMAKFVSESGSQAARTARNVGSTVASHAGDLAEEAKEKVSTVTSEIEGMARRNPLGTIGASLLAGVLIGMMTRGRR